jgi:antitoxin component YwqK of YwqJK toxin-antitoxin module
MRVILALFLVCIIFSTGMAQESLNHTDAAGMKQGLWKKYQANGRPIYEGSFKDDRPSGEWKRYHENGALRALLQYKDNSDSVFARLYDTNGKPIAEGKYLHEKKTGLWYYFNNERKVSEEEFSDGMKNGTSRVFYPTGEILEEAFWKDDLRNGKYRAYYLSGKPFLECMYENNRRNGFCVTYYPSGTMEVDAFYTEDLPDGDWKYFTEEGSLRYTLHYSEGVLLNREVLMEVETGNLKELEKRGRNITDPEKYMQDPTEFLLQIQR